MNESIDWISLTIGVAAGLSFFLYGLYILADSLKRTAGPALKRVLSRFTTNRFKGAFAGAFVTAVVQSSSVTTVLLVGFISAGLMTLTESVGVIMGANIGSTITAQIIAFKVTKLATVLIAVGGLGFILMSKRSSKDIGMSILGLGLVFFGMTMMSDSTVSLRSFQPFVDLMKDIESPLLGILIGAVFTAVVQSSAATMGIVIVFASQGLLSLEGGIALAFGANIGTCATALLASIGKPAEAIRAAYVHVLFNVIGVLIWVGFIPELVLMTDWLTSLFTGEPTYQVKVNVAREIANAHTLFNVANTILLIGLAGPMARLATWMVKDRPDKGVRFLKAKYLDDVLLATPALALDRARMELLRMGGRVLSMIRRSADVVMTGNEFELGLLKENDEEVDALFGQIATYLGRISVSALSVKEAAELKLYLNSANVLENMGDLIESRLVHAGFERARNNDEFSVETLLMLKDLVLSIVPSVETAIEAMDKKDLKLARQVNKEKSVLNTKLEAIETHLAKRLALSSGSRAHIFGLESEIVESSRRLYDLAKRISRSVLDWHDESNGKSK